MSETEIGVKELHALIKDAAKQAADESTKDLAKTVAKEVIDAQKTEPEEPTVAHNWQDAVEAQEKGKDFTLPAKTHNPTTPIDTVPKRIITEKPKGAGSLKE